MESTSCILYITCCKVNDKEIIFHVSPHLYDLCSLSSSDLPTPTIRYSHLISFLYLFLLPACRTTLGRTITYVKGSTHAAPLPSSDEYVHLTVACCFTDGTFWPLGFIAPQIHGVPAYGTGDSIHLSNESNLCGKKDTHVIHNSYAYNSLKMGKQTFFVNLLNYK